MRLKKMYPPFYSCNRSERVGYSKCLLLLKKKKKEYCKFSAMSYKLNMRTGQQKRLLLFIVINPQRIITYTTVSFSSMEHSSLF